jgi:glutaredoxin
MKPRAVRLFIKPYCGWCHEVMEWLESRGIEFETLDVVSDSKARREMEAMTGQDRAPSIDVDGEVLADFGADELEAWWTKQGFEGGN